MQFIVDTSWDVLKCKSLRVIYFNITDLEMAIAYWNLVLNGRFKFLDLWNKFLLVSFKSLRKWDCSNFKTWNINMFVFLSRCNGLFCHRSQMLHFIMYTKKRCVLGVWLCPNSKNDFVYVFFMLFFLYFPPLQTGAS